MIRCPVVVFICLIFVHPAASVNLTGECHPDVLVERPPQLSEFAKETLFLPNTALIETEQIMREQGYSEAYIAGLDVVKRNLQLAKALRHVIIRPWTDYIPTFVSMIDRYIHFIERDIRLSQSSDREHRLNQLQAFKIEAEMFRNSERVAYRWYLYFIYRLSILATPQEHRGRFIKDKDWVTNEALETAFSNILREDDDQKDKHLGHLFDRFPDVIVLPTTSDLGIISLNRTAQTGVYLLRLINQPTYINGRLMYPQQFWEYNVQRAININRSFLDRKQEVAVDLAHFHNTLIYQRMRALPKPLRERVELIYYGITYESPESTDEILAHLRRSDRSAAIRAINDVVFDDVTYEEFLPFVPDSLQTQNEVFNFVQRGIVDFVDLALQINTL